MALPWALRVILERKIARWVWEEKRAITITEIAEHFGIDVPSTRKIARSILRRTDGIVCSLDSFRPLTELVIGGLLRVWRFRSYLTAISRLSLPENLFECRGFALTRMFCESDCVQAVQQNTSCPFVWLVSLGEAWTTSKSPRNGAMISYRKCTGLLA